MYRENGKLAVCVWSEGVYDGEVFSLFDSKERAQEVKLPNGYKIADGNTTPAFYLSNVHRMAFGYGRERYRCEHGSEEFENLRKMKYYDKDFNVCILGEYKRLMAMGIYRERWKGLKAFPQGLKVPMRKFFMQEQYPNYRIYPDS